MAYAVVCPQPVVAEVALDVLAEGGNAVDAVVSGAMVQGVVDPLMCGPGGYGVMTVHEAGSGRTTVLDFFARAPLASVEGVSGGRLLSEFSQDYGYIVEGLANEVGYRSIATPGTVAGLGLACERFGTRPWSAALEPALAVARDGFTVTLQARAPWAEGDGPDKPGGATRMAFSETGRALYLDADGAIVPTGHVVRNPDLAHTLERLAAAGPQDFYTGEIAAAIVADTAVGGSDLDAEDLRAFQVGVTEPVVGTYRGRRILLPGYPAGGPSVLQALGVLEVLAPGGPGDWVEGPGALALATALHAAILDKYEVFAGPRDQQVSVQEMLAPQRLQALAQRVAAQPAGAAAGSHGLDVEPASTTHLAVVDAQGNAAAVTHTLASGSGVITGGLGFMYNNFLHGFDPRAGRWNSLRPGATRPASMSPGLVLDGDGSVSAVVGATGSTRIVSSLVQVLSHLLDRGWDPVRAVSAPRVNAQRSGAVQLEGRFPDSALAHVRAAGREAVRHPRNYDPYFGKAHVLARTAGGWDGAADPRGDGGIARVR